MKTPRKPTAAKPPPKTGAARQRKPKQPPEPKAAPPQLDLPPPSTPSASPRWWVTWAPTAVSLLGALLTVPAAVYGGVQLKEARVESERADSSLKAAEDLAFQMKNLARQAEAWAEVAHQAGAQAAAQRDYATSAQQMLRTERDRLKFEREQEAARRRPRLFVDHARMSGYAVGQMPNMHIRVRNSGDPPNDVRALTRMDYIDRGTLLLQDAALTCDQVRAASRAGTDLGSSGEYAIGLKQALTEAQMLAIGSMKATLRTHGTICYDDLSGRTYRLQFCRLYIGDGSIKACPNGNRTD